MSQGIKRGLSASVSAAALIFATGAATAQEDTLNVYNWSDYIAADTVPKFEEEFGVSVNYDVYDSNEVLEGTLMAGGTGYDVVVPSGSFFQRQIEAGIYQKLDKSKLDNWDHLDPQILEQVAQYDPGNEYGVPYMWGTTGIGYNVAMVEERLGADADFDTWDLIFDPETAAKLADCGVTLLDAPTEVFNTARQYLGLDPLSTDEDDLQAAVDLIMEIRPHIRYFHSSQYINDLANGEVCVSMGWSGDVFIAADRAEAGERDVEVAYTIPREGATIWFDIMAIPEGAPHPDNAHKWLNYQMRPEVAAENVNYVWYATANQDALPMIDDDIKNDPAIYPSEEVMESLFVDLPQEPRFARVQTRAWTRVKTGQ